ncbi:hypothetical protein N7495_009330 [Penicillium taxi]|uniref:uncharacterized protein n=1 Tax=Penicillium taxi TaxID=168475 RepID=UPI002545AD9B|nr:uncharacterized protein N7495_009330 [Penicillium taxi]KAJ5884820.1 hypothetical protein N7495_009330 [Penicillium taxi]
MLELEGRSLIIFIVTAVFLGISFVVVCLRCLVRIRIVRAFGWDDLFMIFAMWWWLGQAAYVWACALAKISIALTLLRLTVFQTHKVILYSVIAVNSAVGLVFWAMITFQCQPVFYFWQRALLISHPTADIHGTCMNLDRLIIIAYVYSGAATCCDMTLGILPFFLVWKLKMGFTTKASLAAILDATTQISIWSNVEASLGIAAGSLVTLRPLFRWMFDPNYSGPESRSSLMGGSLPLSHLNVVECNTKGQQHPQYWRPDIGPEETHAIITTIHTVNHGSRVNSQGNMESRCGSLQINRDVSIQRNFSISELPSRAEASSSKVREKVMRCGIGCRLEDPRPGEQGTVITIRC